ncbi:Putative Heme-regulated two-component response regulator [plant metagenome]|uniref:Diguanylate cyclase DosC n=1 Tax=plant metagenome TaxID=1297885 RepID=A0A484VDT5_9ZZZZ
MPYQSASTELLATTWRRAQARHEPRTHARLRDLVAEHRTTLATRFYEAMLESPSASRFLSHQLVQTRLHAALQRWLDTVFDIALNARYDEAVAFQRHIGEVHARIGIPSHLVMQGARALMMDLHALLADAPAAERAQALACAVDTIGQATEIMCHAYDTFHERNTRAEESYRLFVVSQDIVSEKEKQRAALLDWENAFVYEVAVNGAAPSLPRLGKSEFGMWFLHKAAHAFEGSKDVENILAQITQVDEAVAGLADTPAQAAIPVLKTVREQCATIRFLLEGLFAQAAHLESGRDTLTRLLNRKYLQVVMAREINYVRQTASHLSVLSIDIDHFKGINDQHGHDGGDAVLQHLALFLTQSVRSGDYLFRLGGEEFLIVLVDANEAQATAIGEKLRRRAEHERIALRDGQTLSVTLSIGVATHDGHPDYQRLLSAADAALYGAKRAGRNRVLAHSAL